MRENNIRLRWGATPDPSLSAWEQSQHDYQLPGDPGAYANKIDIFYIFDEIIKDKTIDGRAINSSKARYSIKIEMPIFLGNRMRDIMDFLLAQYKRIEVYADYVPAMFRNRFNKDNTINLITESFDYDNFSSHVAKKVISMQLISEESLYNIYDEGENGWEEE